ncbi:hypothetical protein BD769DRAFT_1394129 [Suillus cothurnatus]|nr:hypothetical protein BD769DRAFT_1394129 [Suillus cothurnatus]
MLNQVTLYKALPPPSGKITAACKRIARAKIRRGYRLRPSIWSNDSEPDHQEKIVKDLIKEGQFPPTYIFGWDEMLKMWFAFENEVLLDIVLDALLELGWQPYLEDLDNMFCTAALAVHCALLELSNGGFVHTEFTASDYKPMYDKLQKYIKEHIVPDAELLKRWVEYKKRASDRLKSIYSSHH